VTDESRDEADARAIRTFAQQQITAAGWGPAELLAWAKGKDADELFLTSVMLVRLCEDPVARTQHLHGRFHRAYGLTGHAGPELVSATQKALGISDARAASLIEHLDDEARYAAGLSGTAED